MSLPSLVYILFIAAFFFVSVFAGPFTIRIDDPNSKTEITTKNITASGRIMMKIVKKPHHLFIGRCNRKYPIIHQENIILTNDGKSHVSAHIRMNVDGPFYINCVNIHDETPDGEGGYPSFAAGGVGHNFVEFNVMTHYGKGFHFFVQIRGYTNKTLKSS
ncbi:unnamed protein product [Phaedon cochleariae]|uniref:Uncharacterized protein n=1 Tax=Phaedon cochleariae TaxID=80249 RepID=A0A9N9SBH4_PHACE|nr:unnamed protein product [Phaedon cochleariae]